MQEDLNKPIEDDDHDMPPQDETTKDRIGKHLSDINSTISEEDMKNINTDTGATPPADNRHDKDEADEIIKHDDKKDDEELEREAPSPWTIID